MAGIKGEIGIDGAAKFRSEMRNVRQSIKELDSELKLADSQFRATGNAEEYMSERASILKKQLEKQSDAVKLLEGQLESAKAQYGENSTQVSKLKTELNKAKTQQNNLKTALAETTDPLGTAAEQTGALAEKTGEASTNAGNLDTNLQNVVSHLDFQTVARFADGVGGAIEWAAKKAKELAVQVWNLGTEAGTTADDWLTMSTQYGISVEDIQKWNYAGRFVDTTLENITGSMVKFRQKYADVRESFDELTALQSQKSQTKDKKTIETLDKRIEQIREKANALKSNFGIDIYDAEHNLRATTDVYWDMIDVIGNAYNNGNQELAEQAAMDWFGRSAANLNPLFKAGKKAFMELGDEAEQMGYVMSETDVQALGAFDDKMQTLQASIDALKLNMANDLLPVLTAVADGFTEISNNLLAYLETEEGKKAISDMASAIGGIVTDISTDIPGAIQTVTGYVTTFAQGFTDAEGAVQKLIGTVKTLGIVWAGTKLIKFGADALDFANSVKSLFGGGSGKPTPTPSAPSGGTGNIITGGGTFLTGLFSTVGNWAQKIMTADPTGSLSLVLPVLQDQTAFGRAMTNGLSVGDALKAEGKAIEDYAETVKKNASTFQEDWSENVLVKGVVSAFSGGEKTATVDDYADALKRLNFAMQELEDGNGTTMLEASVSELQNFGSIFSEDVKAGLSDFKGIPAEDFSAWVQSLHDQLAVAAGQAGENTDTVLADAISANGGTVEAAGSEVAEQAVNGVESVTGQMTQAGVQAMNGLSVGLRSGGVRAQMTAVLVANSVAAAVKRALKINSPSRVMAELGYYTSEGFALGIEDGAGSVSSAVNGMLSAVGGTPIYGGAPGASGGTAGESLIAALNGAQVVMDGETVGRLIFPFINNEMGAVAARRYAS